MSCQINRLRPRYQVAHTADVNVISWNPLGAQNLLLSGSDDSSFKVNMLDLDL